MNKRVPFQPKPPINLEVQERKLNELLSEVNTCVNKKVNDPHSLEKFKNAFRKTQPKLLKGGQLKEYQKEALVWMIELSFKKMNGILADDMGLGKTIQSIAYLAYLMEEHSISGKHLIICPLTVCNNWQRQLKKWMPSLHVEILWGTEQAREYGLENIVKPRNFDVLITPYHSAMSNYKIFKKIPWEVFIIDEAHKIKNDEAILTGTVKEFDAKFKLLLTGTPLSNNLRELWSLLNFIMPELFHDRKLFDQIEDGIKEHNGDENEKFDIQCRIAKKFHGIIRPFIMRRTKKDTDLGLPTKTEHTLYVSMTKLQLKMYKNYLKYKSVYGMSRGSGEANSQMTTRKICNHPYLFKGIEPEDAEQYGEHLVENCGKMIVLDKLLCKLIDKEKRKILIFSQFKIQLDILEDYCTMRNYNYFRLDGDSPVQERQEMMNEFNEDTTFKIPIFMLSTRAGGLGVNLVAASVVIIYDIDWNPQNDAQAMDRAYRIGQVRAVNVYKMVTEHTIEERMLQVQKYKLIWDELVIQKGTIINLKNQDIFSGLNYEKIANMKKGQIFKVQARKDNTTIDEIIKMGQAKDDKKYNEIKAKVMKQIEQQKTTQNFNANPFEDQEIRDQEGDALMKRFDGEVIGKNQQVTMENRQKNEKRAKLSFLHDFNVPEHHLFTDPEEYKEIIWQHDKKKRELELMDLNDVENKGKDEVIQKSIQELQEKIKNLESEAFNNWEKDEFDAFINQEKKEFNSSVDNIKKLHELIPTKTMNEIRQYKKHFYQLNANKNLPRISKIKKELSLTQIQNQSSYHKTQFHKFLSNRGAIYSKPKAPIQNLLNNMRIKSEIEDQKDFFSSEIYKNDETLKVMKSFEGVLEFEANQDRLLSSKLLMKRFFKSNASSFENALESPERTNLIKADFEQRKAKILGEIKRKCFKNVANEKQSKKSEVDVVRKDEQSGQTLQKSAIKQ